MNNAEDIRILRELGKEKFDIGNLPVQKRKFELWRNLNRLENTRPLVRDLCAKAYGQLYPREDTDKNVCATSGKTIPDGCL